MIFDSRNVARSIVCLSIAAAISTPVWAAGGKRVDPFLKKAIRETIEAKPVQPPPFPSMIPEPEMVEKELQPVIEQLLAAEPQPAPVIKMVEIEIEAVEEEKPSGPFGARIGKFLLAPSIKFAVLHDDNILAAAQNEEDDNILSFQPGFRLSLPDSVNKMNFDAAFNGRRYRSNENENTDGFNTRFHGFITASDILTIPYDVSFVLDHEARKDDSMRLLPIEPTKTKTFMLETGFAFKSGPVGLDITAQYLRERYDDGSDGTNPVIRSDDDRAAWELKSRLSYDFEQKHKFYLDSVVGNRRYEGRNYQGGGFNGPYRDSDYYQLGMGYGWNLYGNLSGDIRVGYHDIDYDSVSINDEAHLVTSASLSWAASPNTDLRVSAARELTEDDDIINPMIITRGEFNITHRIGERWETGLGASYEEMDVTSQAREDEIIESYINLDYSLASRVVIGAEYRYTERDSNQSNFDYDRQKAMLHLTTSLN